MHLPGEWILVVLPAVYLGYLSIFYSFMYELVFYVYESNRPKFTVGSSQLRIQSSHLDFVLCISSISSDFTCGKKLCLHFLHTHKPNLPIFPKPHLGPHVLIMRYRAAVSHSINAEQHFIEIFI